MLFLASDTFLRRPTAGPDLRRRDSTESAPSSALPRGGQHPPLRSTTARGRIAPPRRGCVRMRRRSRLVSAGAVGAGQGGDGGGRRRPAVEDGRASLARCVSAGGRRLSCRPARSHQHVGV